MSNKIEVGIILFNEVEVLDFAGPYEVFSLASKGKEQIFDVKTIGETSEVISARNGLKILPDLNFEDNFNLEILIVPGGYGAKEIEIKNSKMIEWIKLQQSKVKVLASVCTGAFLLAEAGILDNKKATTHWKEYDRLEKEYPKVEVVRHVKFMDEGHILTAGGISAGINMSFHIIERLFGVEVVKNLAKTMVYDIEI